MNTFVFRAVRTSIRADSDPVRETLFANLRQSRPLVGLIYGLHQQLGPTLAPVLVACYGLVAFLGIAPPRQRSARILTVARHTNARRQIARVAHWLTPDGCDAVDIRASAPRAVSRLMSLLRPARRHAGVRALRIIAVVDRRHGFLVGCRVANTLAWYACARAILRARRPGAVAVSSDSNPEELGFTAAARSLGIPTVFISHSYPTPFSPPLDFSLSILAGEAEARARARKGAIAGQVVFAGFEGAGAPPDPARFERSNPVIGVFTPKAVSWPTFAQIIADCRQRFHPRQIIVRWHPSMLERPRLSHVLADASDIVESARDATLADVARRCDWVVADENSGVHLPVLRLGIPTIAVRSLGPYPRTRADLYGFGSDRIVMPAVASIRDVDAAAVQRFLSGDWPDRFAMYDAAYLQPEQTIGYQVRSAILDLVEGSPGSRCASPELSGVSV